MLVMGNPGGKGKQQGRAMKSGSLMWRMASGIVDRRQKMEAEVFRKRVGGSDFQRGGSPALTVMPLSGQIYILHRVFLQTVY